MKTIVFDLFCAQPKGSSKFHGGGEYTKSVFKYFVEHFNQKINIIVCYDKSTFLDDWIHDLITKNNIDIVDVHSTIDICNYLNNLHCPDVRFFAGMVYSYKNVTFNENITAIGTCHGLRAIEKPYDEYQLKYYDFRNSRIEDSIKEIVKHFFLKYSMKRYLWIYSSCVKPFSYIITDSNHSEFSIKLNLNDAVKAKEIFVFYPMTQMNEISNTEEGANSDKYIMLISANRWIKNSYRAITALDEMYSKGLLDNINTRVYGGYPQKFRKKVVNKENFKFYDYVPSEELEKAYSQCEVFFYPTLNEGFGNVPMEAMKYGKTCAVSGVCSLPEVYGESVYYFNPYDKKEMQNRILQATEKKIDKNVIETRMKCLFERQSRDMDRLCKLIIGMEE